MATSRGKQYVRPVIVEVKPSNAASSSNIAPSSPSPPSSPKAVRFAGPSSSGVTGISRQLTPPEAWSLYHFECHARQCPECYNPLQVHLRGGQLCANGHALAQDVAEHVYHRAGEVYSTKMDDHKHVRVELPPGYDQVRGLVKSMDRFIRSTDRRVPIISYDANYPVSARRPAPSPTRYRRESRGEREEVLIEPSNTERATRRPSQRKSKHKSKRYSTVVLQDDVEAGEPAEAPSAPRRERERERDREKEPPRPTTDRRGSLYADEIQRQSKDKKYLVEIRTPERRRDGYRRDGRFHE